jgi:hypothetical protein
MKIRLGLDALVGRGCRADIVFGKPRCILFSLDRDAPANRKIIVPRRADMYDESRLEMQLRQWQIASDSVVVAPETVR